MAQLAMNISKLPVLDLTEKGQDVIPKCTDNPLVSGIAAELAEFSTAQTGLEEAHAAYVAAKGDCKSKMLARDAAVATWKGKFSALGAAVTLKTGGNAAAMVSAGFDVRAGATPTQPLEAPANVRVETNGTPGRSKVSCEALAGAVSYLVEMSPDPITAESWEQVGTPTKSSCEVDGAEPGKRHWFRMAGVNALGQGPWSEPVARPVM